MNYAEKLFKESRIKVDELNNTDVISCPDLVSAVLEKNKEINEEIESFNPNKNKEQYKQETYEKVYEQSKEALEARAFREFVSECQLLKTTNNCQISSKKEVEN